MQYTFACVHLQVPYTASVGNLNRTIVAYAAQLNLGDININAFPIHWLIQGTR